jgi:DNA-binding LytR/AlgR family response regulator
MADLEQELKPYGFIRIPRSRLVRRGAIEVAKTRHSGDFDITLRSGEVIRRSRRLRKNLMRQAQRE